ncbi:MAG: prolipoprotein diacylglyceryl transferase [Legionellales bacterium]|nr:prolipoprotein diacylglyceryl transferase [Legionellales bacterium]
MLMYPQINPVALQIGEFKIHWYGIMYLIGFLGAWLLCLPAYRRERLGLSTEQVGDLIFYGALGVVLGGRIGYMLFYDFTQFIHQPWIIIRVWDGGMSFHGGLIGVILTMYWFAKRHGIAFFALTDFIAPVVPIGLGAGRIGNFINGELWGRVTTVPWGMIYPQAGMLPRHPSEIYEFLLEGVLLFIILWLFQRQPRPRMATSALFLVGYGCLRFLCEFFRQPDPQLGFIAFGWLTQGQLLSIPMILLGGGLFYFSYRCDRRPSF